MPGIPLPQQAGERRGPFRRVLPRLEGPHPLATSLGVGHEPLPWIAMERVQGETLLPLLDRLPLPIAEVAEVGAAIA